MDVDPSIDTPDPTDAERRAEAEERTLVELANNGDRDALTTLLTNYQPRLYAVCLSMVPNAHTAQELTQDALVKVIENLHSFDGRAKLSTWLIRITMNLCLSHRRKQSLRPTPIDPHTTQNNAAASSITALGSPASHTSPAELSAHPRVQPEDRGRLLAALHHLTPEAHAILVLRDIQQLSYDNIAHALDLAPGTVKSRLFRARAALRKQLEDHQPASSDPDTIR